MRFIASHITRFRYSKPVFLEPHAIRMRPRSDPWQRLTRFRIEIEPEPALLSEGTDAEGNDIAHAWFSDLTKTLAIRTDFEVETLRKDAFDYMVVGEGAMRLPAEYPSGFQPQLAGALALCEPDSNAAADFVRSVVEQTRGQTLPFLTCLNEAIYRSHKMVVRVDGDPLPPSKTLKARRVACRDLAVLFAECCRTVGIAARFVSGYAEQGSQTDENHMHAWAEVFLPGGGWRGYDPSQGLAISDRHVAVAASVDPRLAAPTTGTYRGDASAELMDADIHLRSHGGRVPGHQDSAGLAPPLSVEKRSNAAIPYTSCRQ